MAELNLGRTMVASDKGGGASRAALPLRRWLAILVGSLILAIIAVPLTLLGPLSLREKANVARLTAEVKRLGGKAGVPEGGVDFWKDKIDVDVDLDRTNVGDLEFAQLARMAAFKRVTFLRLAGTRITDASLSLLANSPNIIVLDVSRTAVADEGLRSIATIPELSVLNMSHTDISDAGLEILIKNSGSIILRSLDITHTKATPEGARKLRQAFPLLDLTPGPPRSRENH